MTSITIPTLPVSGPIPPFPQFAGSLDHFVRPVAPVTRSGDFDFSCVRQHGIGLAAKNTFKNKRALLSYSKSGGRWLSRVIQALTGFYVDSFKGFAYTDHNDCMCTVLTETHDLRVTADNSTLTNQLFQGHGVLLIRNPFQTIISNRVREARKRSEKDLYRAFTEEQGWGGYVDVHINQWERVVTNWIRGLRRGGVICYEHMEEDFERELLHLASILGFQSVDKSRLDCVVEFQRQFLAASNNLKYPRDPYTLCQKMKIAQSIERVQLVLKERNLNPLPTELYELYVPLSDLDGLDC